MQSPAFINSGAPDKNRTRNPQIRSLVLYPIELRAPIFSNHPLDII